MLVRFGSRRDRDAYHRYMSEGLHDALDLLERAARSVTSS